MLISGLAAVAAVISSLFFFGAIFPPLVAYFASSAVGLPFLVVMWRLNDRYTDLLFRDDL